jgi:hypothetical protein
LAWAGIGLTEAIARKEEAVAILKRRKSVVMDRVSDLEARLADDGETLAMTRETIDDERYC